MKSPKLYKEYPKFLRVKEDASYDLRIYTTQDEGDNLIRWHFGFPKIAVEPLLPLLETTLYWGEQHWTEDEGFYLWWLPIMTNSVDSFPKEKITRSLEFLIEQYNKCLLQVRRLCKEHHTCAE